MVDSEKQEPEMVCSEKPETSLLTKKSIVMVGLMGAGKSVIGRRLATRLDMPFVDADTEIESAGALFWLRS